MEMEKRGEIRGKVENVRCAVIGRVVVYTKTPEVSRPRCFSRLCLVWHFAAFGQHKHRSNTSISSSSNMDLNLIEMWDTHVHCFDPEQHPFKPTRTYTPGPAPLESLLQNCKAKKVNLVQASIEDGYYGLITHLKRIHTEHPHILARGTICMDENWESLTEQEFNALHTAGVRSCRVHGLLEPEE